MLRPADGIYAMQASLLKTLASPRRLELVHYLGESGPIEVRRLADHFGMPQPAISQHLAALRVAGIVEAVRDGREVRYQLADPEIVAACGLMRQVLIRRIARLGDMAASYSSQVNEPAEPAGVGSSSAFPSARLGS
ncbi:MAG: metalloregulator ArsR/SmtB family transcription factor [Candidatus Limnocylindrales bacterium]|jgi:ArsR family transcriptional regulator